MLLSYKCIIKTPLTKDKIFEVLQEVTIPYNVHSIFIKIKDFIFYEGKFEDKSFTCRPLPTQIPPYGNQNSLMFWVIYIFEGYSILKYSLLLGGFSVAILLYFHFVARKTAELFERILCGKRV